MHPDLHLMLHRLDQAERARRLRWQPAKPQHPPRWRLLFASWLRAAADRLGEAPHAVSQSAKRA